MTTPADRDPPKASQFLNPYRAVPEGTELRGSTVGRWGLAAGVIVIAASPIDPGTAEAADRHGSVTADTQVWLGTGLSVAQETAEQVTTAGYLWPAPPPADPRASPALEF